MPNMTAHCQMIGDLDYMQQRMADMKINMQHCMEDSKGCPMPEMVGEMGAMKSKMDAMTKQMEQVQKENKEEPAKPAAKPGVKDSMSDEFHQHERELNIQ